MQIVIPKTVFNIDDEQYLSPDELVLFCFLYKWKNTDHQIMFTIDLINKNLKYDSSNEKRNRVFIKELLSSLQTKSLIQVNEISKISSDIITGTIAHHDTNYSGIDSCLFDTFLHEDMLKAKLKLYVYAEINKFSEGNKISFNTLSNKCLYFKSKKKHSVTVIQETIDELDGKYIYRFSGERKNKSPEQEVNLYVSDKYMTPDKHVTYNEHVREKRDRVFRRRKDHELITENPFGIDSVKELKDRLSDSNWHKKDDYGQYLKITSWDYGIYRLARDENVAISAVKKIESVIDIMNDNPNCIYDFDKWEKEYLDDMNEANNSVSGDH